MQMWPGCRTKNYQNPCRVYADYEYPVEIIEVAAKSKQCKVF